METALFRRSLPRKNAWQTSWPYLLALASAGFAAALTVLLGSFLNPAPLVLLFAAVFLSSRFGGSGPGLTATVLTVALAKWFVLPSGDSYLAPWQGWVPLVSYILASLMTVAVVAQLRDRTVVLRERDEQLTDFMENATVGLHWLAEDGTLIWANRAVCEILGCKDTCGCIGRRFQDLFNPDSRDAADILRRLAANERIKNYETRMRARDGSLRVVLLDANVLWRDGQFVHARCFLRDITQRKLAEDALSRERNLLRTLIDALPDYVYTKDLESRYIVSNLANIRLLGARREEDVRGRTLADFRGGDFVKSFLEDDLNVISSGRPLFEREEPFQDASGLERIFLTTKLPLRDEAGAVTGLVGISRDVTDRKRAGEALRKSEASLRLAQRIGRIGSWEVDLDRETIAWSHETFRIFGTRHDAFIPTPETFFDFVHPDDRALIRRASERALLSGKYYSVDYRITTADGQQRFVVQQARIERDDAGRPIRMVGTVQDITDRKTAEQALRESEERFRVLFERSPEGISILDPHDPARLLPILDCNEIVCRQHGYNRDEIIGESIHLLTDALNTREQVEQFVERLRNEKVVQMESFHRHKDGSRFCLESWLTLIVINNRELLLGMSRDISERKQAEDAVRHLNEELEARVQERTQQLEQANRELEAFSYSISHDLRAPVRAISGFAQIIEEDYGASLESEVARLFKVIADNAQRMGELIDDLLSFSRLNVHDMRRDPVDMTALAQSVIAESTMQASSTSDGFRLHELPPATGDESMLRQVLTNLVGNAIKFSRKTANPFIEIGATQDPDRVTYFVRDNGIGFDMRYAAKLFKVFQRLHNPEQFEGTGVGLAIVQRVVQRHGGEVWAESQPGEGTTFFFSLPANNGSSRAVTLIAKTAQDTGQDT